MRVLLICGDYWHPAQIAIDGVAPLAEQGFQFDVYGEEFANSSREGAKARRRKEEEEEDSFLYILKEYPAVILAKSDWVSKDERQAWITEAEQKAFVDYVEKGGGLVVVHSGIDYGKGAETLGKLIGCKFIFHPNNCPVTVGPVKPHPVTEGVGLFCETDEHYRIEITADDADVLLASYSPPQGEESKYREDPYFNTAATVCAAGFVRTVGKGRVCVLTPGHLLTVWLNPQFQKLLANALKWTSRE